MSDDRLRHSSTSLDEATISSMWEIAAMAKWRQSPPPSEVLPSGLSPGLF